MSSAPPSEMRFELKYIGSAVEPGRMNARDLAPAILGVAEILEATSEVLYGDRGRLRVEVDADFERGSFLIEFVAGTAISELIPLTLQDLANIVQIVGFTAGGAWSVVKLIRWQRGRRVEDVLPGEDLDHVKIVIQGEQVIVGKNIYDAFANQQVRRGFDDIVTPLQRDGIDALQIQAGERGKELILSDEARYFSHALTPQQKLPPEERKAFLEILSPTFKEGNKWEFRHAAQTFHAEILDQEFLQRVRRREITFGQGDVLRVTMRVEETVDHKGVHPVRRILKVHRYYPAEGENGGQVEIFDQE